MCEETLVCVSEGIFDLGQLCEAVMIFANFYPDRKKGMLVADKLWSGIMDHAGISKLSVHKKKPHIIIK